MKNYVILILLLCSLYGCSALLPNYAVINKSDKLDSEMYGRGKLPFNTDSSDVNFEKIISYHSEPLTKIIGQLNLTTSDRISKINERNYIVNCSKAVTPSVMGIEFGPEPFYLYYNINISIVDDLLNIRVDKMIGKRSDTIDNYPSKYNSYSVRRKEIIVKPAYLRDSECVHKGYLSDSYICCWRRVFIDVGNNIINSIN